MAAPEIVLNVLFYAFAAAAVGGAVAVAAGRNIVRSAFSLLAVLLSVAALYAVMKADFVAAAQVLIYVGGILVLIIFAVMLTHRIADVNLSNESAPGPAAFFACLLLLLMLVGVSLSYGRWERDALWAGGGGEARLQCALYQADGRTGLEPGGDTLEDRVVVAVRAEPRWEAAEVEAFRPWEKETPPVRGAAPLAGGEARVELRNLAEGLYAWRVRLRGGEGRVTEWTEGYNPGWSAPFGFHVHRGLTKRLAQAFMGKYLFAFEVVSILLLAALVGATTLARKEVRE